MSVINPNETAATWKAHKKEAAVQLYLSGAEGDAADLVGARVASFPLSLNVVLHRRNVRNQLAWVHDLHQSAR